MPNPTAPTTSLLAEVARRRAISNARADLQQARAGKFQPAVDLDAIARGCGFTKTDPVAGLWTRRDLVALIQHLAAAPKAAAPATTRPATVKPLVVPSRTPCHDQLEKLTGAEKTAYYRANRDRLDHERRRNVNR